MSTIVTRAGKGSALTHNEVDANFNNLNNDKIEAAQSVTLTNKTLSTGTAITAGTINNATIGASTPSSGAFTTLSASSTVSGTGFSTYLASPPAIGGTAAAAGSFTTLSATGVTTVQAGTVSDPAITTSGDTNTGIFFPAADTIAFTEGGVESGRFTSTGALQLNSNLTFSGTGNRITGDFSTNTIANRVAFQTSTVNGNTILSLLPNGTGTATAFHAFNNSDPTNAARAVLQVTNAEVTVSSGIAGTGTYLPMTFYTGGSERMRLDTSGNLGLAVTPSAWRSTSRAIQFGAGGFVEGRTDNAAVASYGANAYLDSTGAWRYLGTGTVSLYQQASGHFWYNAASGTAGNAVTLTNAMTLDASGRLGLGETNPACDLDISKASGDVITRYRNGTGTGIVGVRSDNAFTEVRAVSNHGIQFSTNNTERARIDSSGNVGIGTSSPNALLDVYTTQGGTRIAATHGTGGTYPKVSGISFGSTSTSISPSNNGGTTTFVGGAGIYANNTAASNNPTDLVFWTTAGGSPAERARIDASGFTQFSSNLVMPYQGAPTSKSGAATLTGAELVTGILNTTGTTYTITLPTGTNIEGALTWSANNVCLDFFVINTASGTITIGANGNTTLGSLTIATGTSAQFRIRRTAANTFTVYRL